MKHAKATSASKEDSADYIMNSKGCGTLFLPTISGETNNAVINCQEIDATHEKLDATDTDQ